MSLFLPKRKSFLSHSWAPSPQPPACPSTPIFSSRPGPTLSTVQNRADTLMGGIDYSICNDSSRLCPYPGTHSLTSTISRAQRMPSWGCRSGLCSEPHLPVNSSDILLHPMAKSHWKRSLGSVLTRLGRSSLEGGCCQFITVSEVLGCTVSPSGQAASEWCNAQPLISLSYSWVGRGWGCHAWASHFTKGIWNFMLHCVVVLWKIPDFQNYFYVLVSF